MPRNILVALILTFVTGIAAGVYTYLMFFAPEHSNSNVSQQPAVVVEGRMYGGCARANSCATFQFADDRSYHYQGSPDSEVQSGTLPKDVVGPVLSQMRTHTIELYAQAQDATSCRSYTDGIDYAYAIALEGDHYALDTCSTRLPYDGSLQQTLLDVWQYMANPTTTYPNILKEGLGGYIINRFKHAGE